jgi:hypothetical protein
MPALITADAKTSIQHRNARAASTQRAMFSGSPVRLQGCNWLKCGGVAISCLAACASGIGSAACIACLGSVYGECKDCF